jgi:hypothetical protein
MHSADVSHDVGVLAERLATLKARSTAHLVVPHANVRLQVAVLSKRATAHFAHVVAQLEMHGASCLFKWAFWLNRLWHLRHS